MAEKQLRELRLKKNVEGVETEFIVESAVDSVKFIPQSLTTEQQEQVKSNLNIIDPLVAPTDSNYNVIHDGEWTDLFKTVDNDNIRTNMMVPVYMEEPQLIEHTNGTPMKYYPYMKHVTYGDETNFAYGAYHAVISHIAGYFVKDAPIKLIGTKRPIGDSSVMDGFAVDLTNTYFNEFVHIATITPDSDGYAEISLIADTTTNIAEDPRVEYVMKYEAMSNQGLMVGVEEYNEMMPMMVIGIEMSDQANYFYRPYGQDKMFNFLPGAMINPSTGGLMELSMHPIDPLAPTFTFVELNARGREFVSLYESADVARFDNNTTSSFNLPGSVKAITSVSGMEQSVKTEGWLDGAEVYEKDVTDFLLSQKLSTKAQSLTTEEQEQVKTNLNIIESSVIPADNKHYVGHLGDWYDLFKYSNENSPDNPVKAKSFVPIHRETPNLVELATPSDTPTIYYPYMKHVDSTEVQFEYGCRSSVLSHIIGYFVKDKPIKLVGTRYPIAPGDNEFVVDTTSTHFGNPIHIATITPDETGYLEISLKQGSEAGIAEDSRVVYSYPYEGLNKYGILVGVTEYQEGFPILCLGIELNNQSNYYYNSPYTSNLYSYLLGAKLDNSTGALVDISPAKPDPEPLPAFTFVGVNSYDRKSESNLDCIEIAKLDGIASFGIPGKVHVVDSVTGMDHTTRTEGWLSSSVYEKSVSDYLLSQKLSTKAQSLTTEEQEQVKTNLNITDTVVEQVFDEVSVNAQSGVAIQSELVKKQNVLTTTTPLNITDDVISLQTGTTEGSVPILGANGKLENSVIPSLAIKDTYVSTDVLLDTKTKITDWGKAIVPTPQKGDLLIVSNSTSAEGTYVVVSDTLVSEDDLVLLVTHIEELPIATETIQGINTIQTVIPTVALADTKSAISANAVLGLSTDVNAKITAVEEDVTALGTDKQDVLTAGTGIDITTNQISVTTATATTIGGVMIEIDETDADNIKGYITF